MEQLFDIDLKKINSSSKKEKLDRKFRYFLKMFTKQENEN